MVLIRLATLDDCGTCAELSKIRELALTDGSYIPENFFKVRVDDDELFFVAEDQGKVVGYVVGEPLKGGIVYLSLFTVDKSQRGNGLGKQLISTFEEKCRQKKTNLIFFCAPKFNKKTVAFYNKQGFIQGDEQVLFMKQL